MSEGEYEFPDEAQTVIPEVAAVRYSQSLGKLAEALAKAQITFKPIVKRVENTFYSTDKKKAMYADLAAVIEATQKSLAENGLVVIQSPIVRRQSKEAGVCTRMIHSSGEWIENETILPATAKVKIYSETGQGYKWGEKFDAQTCGIAMTYARRYSYQGMVTVAAEEDDDGNSIGEAATGGSKEAAQQVAKDRLANASKSNVGKNDSAAAQASAIARGEAMGILTKVTLATKKNNHQPYLQIEMLDAYDNPLKIFAFNNHQFDDIARTKLFDMLITAGDAKSPVTLKVKRDKEFLTLERPINIAGIRFDDEGIPIIERETTRPPKAEIPQEMLL